MKKNATIKDVANAASVSVATVSRVINRSDAVSEELKQKVTDAIKELDYTPNTAARNLVRRKTGAIGVVVNNLSDPFFHDLIRGFEMGGQRSGYNVIFCSVSGGDPKAKEKYVRYLSNGVVDGVILYGSYLSDKAVVDYLRQDTDMSYVMIENDIDGINCNKMLIDNYGGAKMAVNYLIEQGHKRIAHISGNTNRKVTLERLNAYVETMQEAGLKIDEHYIQHTGEDYRKAYQRMINLIKAPTAPSAVFCSDDGIASYAIRAIQDQGLSVPEDFSIIGFDNQTLLPDNYQGPHITSIEQPLYDIGLESVLNLVQQLESNSGTPFLKTYPTTLIEKQTVKPLVL